MNLRVVVRKEGRSQIAVKHVHNLLVLVFGRHPGMIYGSNIVAKDLFQLSTMICFDENKMVLIREE